MLKVNIFASFYFFTSFVELNFVEFQKEELREQNKVLRGANRDIEKEKTQMEREKKRLVSILVF